MYDASMDVIYIDRLFLINLLIDYLLLLLSARVSGLALRRWRYLLGALLGAAYAVLTLLPGLRLLSLGSRAREPQVVSPQPTMTEAHMP